MKTVRRQRGDRPGIRLRATILTLALLPALSVWAEMPAGDINEPSVFPGARVNTVVMPYVFAGGSELLDSGTGGELSLLVHFDTLFSMMKYRSIGGVRLVGDPNDPITREPDRILDMLLGREYGAREQMRPGHGLVLIWGRIYEEGQRIYIQSYLRFLRRERREDLRLTIAGHEFEGWLPSRGVAFPPRELTRRQLDGIPQAFGESLALRSERDETLTGMPLPLDVGRQSAYWIVGARDGWLELSSQDNDLGGWVRATTELGTLPLQQIMPELVFADGVVGYLAARRCAEEGDLAGAARAARLGAAAMEVYRNLEVEAGNDVEPISWALSGRMTLLAAQGAEAEATEVWTSATAQFGRAATLAPYDAALGNLALVTQLRQVYLDPNAGDNDTDLAARMLRISALEPDNVRLLTNLETLYRLIKAEGPPLGPGGSEPRFAVERGELERRLLFVQEVRRDLERR
ncbi:MAG: hypothetical protein GY835_07905 [bacterium]|nr:hypothetical protein [bacterium]